MFDLSGRVALITGGNGGIGLGMAEGLASQGCEVSIWGTNEDKNAAAVETLEAYGPKVSAYKCNVADQAEVNRCFAETLATHGRVDGCFANAGISARGEDFDKMDEDEWHRIIDVNLNGVFYTFKCATAHMRERADNGDPFGRLVATASLAVISGQAKGEHYAATKGALVPMIKALAIEYARYGVTAHTLLPGWVETGMTEQSFAWDRFVENVMPRIPMRRWGQPEDFAAIACYIMSTATNWHTADTFLIDGGYATF
ncbi:MAG: SDR family oxidoreductase [Gammaproteobacteria bacterium]|nr:SDR family oxidoreductase [Gammaproteobacteria bacterium]MBT7371089.1 SDR family oxidoreductase [Gammaproteobacteria bacterium]